MAQYKINYFIVDPKTGLTDNHPCEIMWFERRGLSRKDIGNMLLACTWADRDIVGFVYRNNLYIGAVEVNQNDLYKSTSVIFDGKQWYKHQWKRRAA